MRYATRCCDAMPTTEAEGIISCVARLVSAGAGVYHSVASMSVALTAAWARGGLTGDRALLLCATVLTLWRSLAPIIDQRLNSDEALTGLMAKHLADGRAFPLFMYGLPYITGIEAWLA